MEFKKPAVCGTLESSDIMITILAQDEKDITVELSSSVEKQFGDDIRQLIKQTVSDLGVDGVFVKAVDKGALDCTIKARVKTAIFRACEVNTFGGQING
ncbi:MAG: citrate lyase acyl carrier protein [Clostridia bacterium]